jgi:hypothetical protein
VSQGGKVNILGYHNIGYCKHQNVSHPEQSYFNVQDHTILVHCELYRQATRLVLTEVAKCLILTAEFSKMRYTR